MRVDERLGTAGNRIDYAPPGTHASPRTSSAARNGDAERLRRDALADREFDISKHHGAWTAAWCRPADTLVALAVLFAIVVVANDVPHLFTIAEFMAYHITMKNALLLGVFVTMWPLVMTASGAYDRECAHSFRSVASSVITGCAGASALTFFAPLLSKTGKVGWESLLVLWVGSAIGTLGIRLLARLGAAIHKARTVPKQVVIVGTGARASKLWETLSHDPLVRYDLVAVCDVPEAEVAEDFLVHAMIHVGDLEAFFMRTVVDEVYVALPVRSRYDEIKQILRICEDGGVHSRYLADTFSPTIALPRASRSPAGSVIAMHVVHDDWRLHAKRAIDFCAALFGGLMLLPLLLLVALAIKLTSRGPVLFTQQRYGLKKRRFTMFKFRTMVPNAEQQMAALEQHNEATGAAFKMKNDPRVTSIGRFLRRSSLDELPQLWNVVIGDMSLVGPRPMALRDVSLFDEAWLMRRFSVRPGLTCLWQVSGRSNLTFEEWMKLDLAYIDGWSLGLDALILAKTIPAVLRAEGAT